MMYNVWSSHNLQHMVMSIKYKVKPMPFSQNIVLAEVNISRMKIRNSNIVIAN